MNLGRVQSVDNVVDVEDVAVATVKVSDGVEVKTEATVSA